MKKFVTWKIGRGIWKGTSAENYNFKDCWTEHDVRTCVKTYLGNYEVEIVGGN